MENGGLHDYGKRQRGRIRGNRKRGMVWVRERRREGREKASRKRGGERREGRLFSRAGGGIECWDARML